MGSQKAPRAGLQQKGYGFLGTRVEEGTAVFPLPLRGKESCCVRFTMAPQNKRLRMCESVLD